MVTMSRRTFGTASTAVAAGAVGAVAASSAGMPQAQAAEGNYLIGTGIYDITGAVAETGAFGYAASQEMTGLHHRLYAHAFIFGDPDTSTRVVFVSVDLGAVFQSIKMGVTAALAGKFDGAYRDDNVLISATHTHVGTAGLSHDLLYQVAANDAAGYGYDKRNYQAVVNGIVAAIERAHNNLAPGNITLQQGELTGATRNRSVPAYRNNKDAHAFDADVNTTMTQLKLTAADGAPRGLLNWFAIHPTSFSLKTDHISSDNKGYAQYFFEREMGSHPTDENGFVGAFAQSDEGDTVSSQGNSFSSPGFGGSPDDFVNVEIDGSRQLAKARELFHGGGTTLTGPVDMRSRWVNFTGYTVRGEYAVSGADTKLPMSARGYSFAVGAENGPSNIPGLYEGMTNGSFSIADKNVDINKAAQGTFVRLGFGLLGGVLGAQDPAQGAKAVLLPDGKLGLSPTQLQFQVIRLGQLAIIAVPGEATTMSGRRICAEVLKTLEGTGVTTAVIAGLANQYVGYIATPEEYELQHYEGASTEFGPNQLGAFIQEFHDLAVALRKGTAAPGITPTQRGASVSRPGVVLDDKPLNQKFGQVLTQPLPAYLRGQKATAVFRGGHPKNDFRTMGTFLKVQRLVDGTWQDYLDDHDWDTSYTWKREGASYSRCTVTWWIRDDAPTGTYRLLQLGNWKNGWNGKISEYVGTSKEFTVN